MKLMICSYRGGSFFVIFVNIIYVLLSLELYLILILEHVQPTFLSSKPFGFSLLFRVVRGSTNNVKQTIHETMNNTQARTR